MGQSWLGYVDTLPVDVLKIDRSFVQLSEAGTSVSPFTNDIVNIGKKMDNALMVAEGIETAAEATAMREKGCQLGQGYHFGRPVEAEAFVRRLADPA
jgi:sensor c-di-GMP phosphodiesterase-like protein